MKSLLYLLLIQFYFIFAQQSAVLVSNSQAADNSNNKYANCLLAKDPGPCKGMVPRFYYDSSLKKCADFTYGGCAGNGNNFPTIEACNEACGALSRT